MDILVTGGNGFIGSNLINRLIEEGHYVISIDNLSTGKKENTVSHANYLYADINDIATIDFKATLSGASVTGQTLREFGIFGELPQDDQFDEMRLEGVQISGTAATDGTEATVETIMLGRVNFDGVSSLSASDEIEFVYTVEVE